MMRRTIGISATAAAITLAASLPAGAASGPGLDSYAAGARATALDLSVFGEEFSVANTQAEVFSVPQARADGQAVLTPLFSSDGAQVASDAQETLKEDCAGLPDEVPVDLPPEIKPFIVCVTTKAVLEDGKPIGTSDASEIVIELQAPAAIGETPLNAVVEGVQEGLGSLFDALVPVTEPLEEETQIQLEEIINGLIDEIQEGDLLARITVAPAASASKLAAEGVLASAASNGVIVELLPELPGGALAVATVGSSTASVLRDADDGEAHPSGDAALIEVTYPNGLLGGLEVLTNALGTAVTAATTQLPCAETNPLAGVLCFDVGSGRELNAAEAAALDFDYGPTTVGYETSVLNLTLLGAAPQGGVVLDVGHTAAAAAATTKLPGGSNPPPPPLPSTGGDTALPVTLALLGMGALGAVLLRRSRTV